MQKQTLSNGSDPYFPVFRLTKVLGQNISQGTRRCQRGERDSWMSAASVRTGWKSAKSDPGIPPPPNQSEGNDENVMTIFLCASGLLPQYLSSQGISVSRPYIRLCQKRDLGQRSTLP
jgi:hypothetical protein